MRERERKEEREKERPTVTFAARTTHEWTRQCVPKLFAQTQRQVVGVDVHE